MRTTKREILFSVIIICVMLIIGIIISGNINDEIMEKQQEYMTALQINNDKDLFEYGMRTNVGNAFVYGTLKAIDTVTFDEIGGEYSYVEKIKERYTKHTQTVTDYDEKGNVIGTHEEEYWTWDRIDSWSLHSNRISFLEVEFGYGTINFPNDKYICTIKESSKIRYKYYGAPTYSVGTIYTKLVNNTISDATMYHSSTIEEALDIKTNDSSVVFFWFFWFILTGCIVYGFYSLDNRWLEDRQNRRYY